MAGIFLVAMCGYLLGGALYALDFTLAWRDKGCALGGEWAGLAAVAFFLWPLIRLEEFRDSIRNRKRNRLARLRRRV